MVKLRLMRMGKTKQPTYRIVAADSRSPRNGRFIEIIGTYQPRLDPSVIDIDTDKAVRWLKDGAQPTERVEKLLKVTGAWDAFKGLPEGTSVTEAPAPAPKPEPTPEPVAETPAVEEAAAEPSATEEAADEPSATEETTEAEEAPAAEAAEADSSEGTES